MGIAGMQKVHSKNSSDKTYNKGAEQ